ncbi:dethiobiotin synthase, partial [Streptomyces tubercidicus]
AGLGALNTAALTADALRARALSCAGFVIGSWPDNPDMAARSNLADLPAYTRNPLLGAVPAGASALTPDAFRQAAPGWLAPRIGGLWDADAFTAIWTSVI